MEGYCPTRQGRSDRSPAVGAKLKWSFPLGEPVATTPVIAVSGAVFVGTQASAGVAAALHRIDGPGAKVWTVPIVGSYAALATPAIGADGTLYVVTYDQLVALRDNGSEVWRKPIGISAFPAPPTVGGGGSIYVAHGANPGKLLAFDSQGGTQWAKDLPGIANAQPAVGLDGTVYVTWEAMGTDLSSEVGLSAFAANGSQLWSQSVRKFSQIEAAGLALEGGPVALDDGSVAVTAGDALYAVTKQAVTKVADLGAEPLIDPVIGVASTFYVATRAGELSAFDGMGIERWSRTTSANPKTLAVGANGVLLGRGAAFSQALGGMADQLFAFSPDGALLPAFDGELADLVAPGEGGVAIGPEGALFVGLGRGLYVIGD